MTTARDNVRFDATIAPDADGSFVVNATVQGIELDRRDTVGYIVTRRAVAERLAAAINAGAVFEVGTPAVLTDVNGRTYLNMSSRVLARTMNADLNRLGF